MPPRFSARERRRELGFCDVKFDSNFFKVDVFVSGNLDFKLEMAGLSGGAPVLPVDSAGKGNTVEAGLVSVVMGSAIDCNIGILRQLQ